ncbi:MAG: MMPL family transporter [Desulfobacterales bacterium]|nr:MMPL family transporter [Desulfobacterales bacterium]
MTNFRNQIERWFETFARVIYNHRVKVLLIMLIFTIAAVYQIPKIKLDLSTEGFLHKDDQVMLEYNRFRGQYGRDEAIIIAIEPPKIFDTQFLEKLQKFHEDLKENVPYIDDITSMINARNTRGEGDTLIVEDLLEKMPVSEQDMAEFQERVLRNQMYKNLMISENGKMTAIVIKTNSYSSEQEGADDLGGFETEAGSETIKDKTAPNKAAYFTDEENSKVVAAVNKIMKKYESEDFQIYLAGSPVVTHFLKRSMMKDVRKFMGLALSAIALTLFIMFRRISGVIMPLIVVFISILETVGLMAIFGVPIKLPTQILPSFILAVGVGASVHILAIFYQRLRDNTDKREAIVYSLGHSGLAVVMTHVTTATGLLSFSTANVAPIADLGIFSSVGVMIALINTVVLLPAMLAIVSIKSKAFKEGEHNGILMDRFLRGISSFSTSHPYKIIMVSALVIIISIAAITKVQFSHHVLSWFPKNSEIRLDTQKIDKELRGSMSLEVIVDTGKENGLYEPDMLNRLEKAAQYTELLTYKEVFAGKAWSVTAILKEINQALNENQSEFYTIPQDRELVAQEFLLFENSGSDDLEDVVDSQFSKARFTIKVPFWDAVQYEGFMNIVSHYFEKNFPDAKITYTGMMALLFQTVVNAIRSLAKSYISALVVITLLMIFLIGRVRIGLLSMIPNLLPILMMIGAMGIFSIRMDLFSMLVASIAIGLAVDDTIHFMHNFRRYYDESGDPVKAVYDTLHTTGRAMLVTTIVLSLGFFIFAFATMRNLVTFGMLTGFTVIIALAADYFLAPALMVVANKPKN